MYQYTKEEELEIITSIAKKLSYKFVFGYFTQEDIQQEAILMGYDGLTRYDNQRPLPNFMYTHINNRLKTFKRDNYYRMNAGTAEQAQLAKKSLMEPQSIDNVNPTMDNEIVEKLHIKEILDKINRSLSPKHRKNYLKLCTGAKLSKVNKMKIIEEIKRIVGDDYDNENR